MGQIKVEHNVGGIEGLCVITPAVHGDNRGYFVKTYNFNDMHKNGSASADGFSLEDGTPLNLSEKDQKWSEIKETFSF